GLERRADVDPSVWTALMTAFPEDSFLVGLSSIHWREAWKYGERAFRYCQHDVGHALAAVRYAAAALGWSAGLLDTCSDADAALLIKTRSLRPAERPDVSAELVRGGTWAGQANPLSPAHIDWPVIDEV